MSIEQRDQFIREIFATVAPQVDAWSRNFSLGFDRLWRRRTVRLSGIKEGDRVLDLCAGTGELAFLLSVLVGPRGAVIGADFCEEMLDVARKKTNGSYINLSFLAADAKRLPFPDEAFDAVTVAFGMRNIPDTITALGEIRRVLRPGGSFTCLELTRPAAPVFRLLYRWYLRRVMPAVAGMVMRSSAPYHYLFRSIEAFFAPAEFLAVVERSGFAGVFAYPLTLGIATIFRGIKAAGGRTTLSAAEPAAVV